jgi:hypothetical protein
LVVAEQPAAGSLFYFANNSMVKLYYSNCLKI